jgi:hypothetical protein
MPYFFIFPAFILLIIIASIVTILCARIQRWRRLYPFAWRILVWTPLGVILANIPIITLYFVPFMLEKADISLGNNAGSNVVRFALAGGLLAGPFIASAAGCFCGLLLAIYLAIKAHSAKHIGSA